ncbi:hypothetical protein GCM10009813_14410 [Brevibacterium marinum]|uniref:Uncharacterized protein n=1 Tax=Brevibacterium marinum TaxID=418643 RepID=A0A846S2B9_9MICO|nr:hypothetical protein [Brevibacterium marinum]
MAKLKKMASTLGSLKDLGSARADPVAVHRRVHTSAAVTNPDGPQSLGSQSDFSRHKEAREEVLELEKQPRRDDVRTRNPPRSWWASASATRSTIAHQTEGVWG